MLPNLPPYVVWVVALPVWVMVATVGSYLVIVNVALLVGDHTEPTDPTNGRYLYLVALLAHLAYLAVFLALTDYRFEFAVPLAALAAPLVGLLVYAGESRVKDAVAGSAGGGSPSGPRLRYLLPVLPIGVLEELFYRGVLFELHASHGPVVYVAASALLFGLAHAMDDLRVAGSKTVDGALYAVAMVATGTVVVPVMVHLGYNLGYLLTAFGVGRGVLRG